MTKNDGEEKSRATSLTIAMLILPALGILAAIVLYSPTLSGGFLCDDYWYIDQAQTIGFAEHPAEALRKGNFYYLRPLPSLLWSVLYHLFSFHAPLYRISSLLLHLGVTASVFFLALRILKSTGAAGLAAIAFAIHPLHGEAVTWVSSNADLLAALFSSLALERYLAWRDRSGPSSLAAVAIMLGLIAMLCKESAYILPAIILCAEVLPGARRPARHRAGVVMVMLGVASALFAAKYFLSGGQIQPPTGSTPISWLPGNIGMGLLRFVAPAAWGSPARAINFALMASLVLAIVRAVFTGRTWKIPCFGLLFLLVALLPPALVGRIGLHLEFSRTLYLPSIGFVIWLGALWAPLKKNSDAKGKRTHAHGIWASALAGLIVCLLFSAGALNLRPWAEAGRASLALEKALSDAGQSFKPGESAMVTGVPMVLQGVPFHTNSYTLSIAFSMARFPELFRERGYEQRNTLPFYAVSDEVPEIEARMILIKKLRRLKTGEKDAFDYRMKWDSPWSE